MKKLLLLPVLILGIILVSCGEKPAKKGADTEKKDDKQLALERGDTIYEETVTYFPGEGQTVRQKFMAYVFMKDGKKKAIRHGEQKSFYKTGKLQAITNYEMGKKQGLETTFYQDGKRKYFERPYVNSKKDGIVKKYYRSGRLQSEIPYKSDFLGTGTQEYADNEKHTALTMPELKVWAKDERRAKGKYTIYAKVETKYGKTVSSKIQFYTGMTISSGGKKYMHPNLKEIKHKNGIVTITHYEQGQGFPPFESISAKLVSSKGSSIFLTQVHNIQ